MNKKMEKLYKKKAKPSPKQQQQKITSNMKSMKYYGMSVAEAMTPSTPYHP